MPPPGLALASVSAKAWRVIGQDEQRSAFYWDFRRALKSAEQNETAFRHRRSLIYGLREALTMMHEEGFADVLARHKKLSAALRAPAARRLDFEIFAAMSHARTRSWFSRSPTGSKAEPSCGSSTRMTAR